MQQPPPEVITANLVFIIFWILVVAMIWLVGQRWERARAFRTRMTAQWKPALIITLICLASNVLAGRSPINPYLLAVFCQALIGLAIARGIASYEPLKTTQSFLRHERIVRKFLFFVVIGIIAGVVGLLIGTFGLGIAQSIFHETNRTREAMQSFSIDKVQAFFQFLGGQALPKKQRIDWLHCPSYGR